MKTALCLGGASCLPDDVARYKGPVDGVIACNDAGPWWPHELDAFVSLHPEKMLNWLMLRHEKGYPAPKKLVSFKTDNGCPKLDIVTDYLLPGQKESGSSGLYIAKVALMDMGFDRAVLCGVPLTKTPHVNGGPNWHRFDHYARTWAPVAQEYKDRIASMSGWSREYLGGPEKWH